MATEEGIVFKMGATGSGTAWVRTSRSSSCESCASRHACHADKSGQEMEVEAVNTAGARLGDRIVLSINANSLLKATFLLYVFPILAMIAGAVLGQMVGLLRGADPSGLSALFGLLFFGLAFVLIRLVGRRLSNDTRYQPQIIKIRAHRSPSADAAVLTRTQS
jgi:sigma-E factor negative regulatory protein RseC